MPEYDLVLRGGRVVDPESGLDDVRDVGIRGASIEAVSEEPLAGRRVVDVAGLVVAPGFIDLHSHAQTLAGRRLQACDGVTAAFDLEAGRSPVEAAYRAEAADGSPIHYGFSASWAVARWQVLAGIRPTGSMLDALGVLGEPGWQGTLSPSEVGQLGDAIAVDLAEGAIGIGLLVGYAPGVAPDEYLAVSQLASEAGAPTFTHCRDLVELAPGTLIDGATELVRAAAVTGCHAHYCHVNSTSARHVDRVLRLVEQCREEGARVTTEAYPYGSGSTAVGAAFLAPDRLGARGLEPRSLTVLSTGERVADATRLEQLRADDPTALVLIDFLDEDDPADWATLRRSLSFEGAVVASDAMPLVPTGEGFDPDAWPIASAVTHPRTAGCFARALRLWRDEGTSWLDSVRRCTLLPARVLEQACPEMARKGRVRAGADADLVVFDPDRLTDRASYVATTLTSAGIEHVFVDGEAVVRSGALVPDARPGRPIRARVGPGRPAA